jgi:hypothetical protein
MLAEVNWAALAPLIVLVLAFQIYCWVDIARSSVKHLPKWAWGAIVTLSVPLGGIAYLVFGREQ